MPKVFTYGPDALQAKMFDRVGPTDFLSAAVLPNHELIWNKPNIKDPRSGLPNAQEAEGQALEGALFELSRKQLDMLDGFFGGYQQHDVRVKTPDGHAVTATTWMARRTKAGLEPAPAALSETARAAEENAPAPPSKAEEGGEA
ncbi:MAG: gamma-glutamylcyclotransferase family protein [Myxococcota bacterium]